MDEQAIQHFSESLSGLVNYINWGSMISFIATLLVTIKKLLPADSNVNVKFTKNIKPMMFPLSLIILTTALSAVLNTLAISFINEFSIKPYPYLYTNLVFFIIWFIIYLLLGLKSKSKLSLIAFDMTEYQKHLFEYDKHRKITEIDTFSRITNRKLFNNFRFKSHKRIIDNRLPILNEYKRLKITILHRYAIISSLFLGSLINGFLISILILVGEDPMIMLVYGFIILILFIQIYDSYNYTINMKNYDHLKHYREENDEDDKE